MELESFREHLFKHIWEYKIALEEFNSFYAISMNEDGPMFDPEDFQAAQVTELLRNLGKDYPLMETYNKVKAYLPSRERSRIIDFMNWYHLHKDDSFYHIIALENSGNSYNVDFIIRLM